MNSSFSPLSLVSKALHENYCLITLSYVFLCTLIDTCVYIYVWTDARLMLYLPSVVATATILFAIKDFEPSEVMQYEILVMNALKVSKVSF